MSIQISVIIPAFNEARAIADTVKRVRAVAETQGWTAEIIVVDDGSTDETGVKAAEAGARVLRHPTNGGYGHSLQDGIRAAVSPIVAITDADGTYPIEDLPVLAKKVVEEHFDMAVGARQGTEYRKGWWKYPARIAFRLLAEFVAGRSIPDINSGLRVMKREKLMPHLSRTCLGFSFTTSITLIFFLNGHFISYTPIAYAARIGKSKVRHFHDTLRTAQIMVSVISAYNPLKLSLLIIMCSVALGVVFGVLGWVLSVPALLMTMAGFFASTPIVFAIGSLAESLRVNAT